MQRHRSLTALAVIGTLAFTARPAPAQLSGGNSASDPIEGVIAVEEQLRADIDALASVVGAGQNADTAIARVRVRVDTWETVASENPNAACAVHARLVRYIDYMADLAQRAQLQVRDVQGMDEHTLETLLDWHIATAIKRAQQAGISEAPLKRAVQLLNDRADLASGTPLESLLRDRFARRVNELIGRAQQAVADIEGARVDLLDVRLSIAIERLRAALRDRGGSRELFELIVDLWKDRARATLGQDFPVCGG